MLDPSTEGATDCACALDGGLRVVRSLRQLRESWRDPGPVGRALKVVATVLLYSAMLIAILALWNNDAPKFIYVAF